VTLWGGRFSEPPDKVLWGYTVDASDRRLLAHDIRGSIAHAEMLGEVGLLDVEETKAIVGGLTAILDEAEHGRFEFLDTDEDVHTAVERRLIELKGPVGGKLHTGRSRNDQMALDLRLYLRETAQGLADLLASFALLLTDLAEHHADVVVASYTHLQQAQSISFGHHLLAYAWMAARDRDRFGDLHRRANLSPLGAGASGGTSLPLDPQLTAAVLGFSGPMPNSLDAVASRDLVAEMAFCCAQAMVHLSRLSEDVVLWASSEFGWIKLADRYATGSSALPHKKNPDIAELARGKTAAVIGDVTTLLVLQKGLPLSYNRDLQEDKPSLFHAADTLAATLEALGGLMATARFDPPAPMPETTALDLAEALLTRGVPFREAHISVGRVVAALIERNRDLGSVTLEEIQSIEPRFVSDDLKLIDPVASASRRTSPGGGSPESVRNQVAALRELLP
jgi:argininosuccinate lyase